MRYVEEYRDREQVRRLVEAIHKEEPPSMRLMEVCGTHTAAIGRFGIRKLLPPQVRLISGPGCPVCVTPQADIDAFISLAMERECILVTFGDMLRVPGTYSTLERQRALGADVRVVYAPTDALEIARQNRDRETVFFGIGFETTAPGVALTIAAASREELQNFSVYCAHKLIPPALEAVLAGGQPLLSGLLLPGHVSTIIGTRVYEPLARGYGVGCVVSGFEPVDILQSILMLVRQAKEGRTTVENQYQRVVTEEGNYTAIQAVAEVFERCTAMWRGIGAIPESGLRIRQEYAGYDAHRRFDLPEVRDYSEPDGCLCGEIIRGQSDPSDCPLFGASCTPVQPTGPCMVSSEGACASWYRYERD